MAERERGRHEFISAIENYTMRYLIVFIVAMVTAFLQIYCWERASDTIVLGLRKAYLSQLLRQDIEWFDRNTLGDLSSKLTDDLERIRDGLGARVPILLQSFSLLVSGQIVAFWRSWKLSLLLLPGLPVLGACIALVASIGSKSSHREQLRYGVAGSIASEAMCGIRTVSAFGAETHVLSRYEKALDEGRKMTLSKHYVLAILTGLLNFISFALYSLGFWYGSTLYLAGELSPGAILTILYCILQAGLAFGANLVAIIDVSTAVALSLNVFRIIKRVPIIDCYSDSGTVVDLQGGIHVQQVSFSYPTRPDMMVLQGIDLKVEAGQVLALVGPSGSGKSSIVNLIMRFYDPTNGKVLLDGRDLSTLNLKSVRNQIGVVSQEPILFDTTIRENIKYGCDSACEEDIYEAAKMANAHSFIIELPQGYDTVVGERGSQLSGGQKQRLAIARALVRKPKILLLDEATSALDSESEAVVQEALDRAMEGRTTLIIAHRLSTVRNAHLICLVKDGHVLERGTHSELISLRGHYFRMLSLQKRQKNLSVHDDFQQVDLDDDDNSIEERKRRSSVKIDRVKKRVSIKVSDVVEKSVSFFSIFKMDSLPWGLMSMMFLGCLISGMLVPTFAIVYSYVVEMFVLTRDEFKKKLLLWECVVLGLAFISCFSYFISLLGSCLSTERMIQTVRLETFRNILRQQVGWFDNKQYSTLKLTNSLARDPPQIKAVAGPRFGSLMTGCLNLVLAVAIAFYANWRLASVCCIVYPVLIFLSNRQTSLRYINFAKEDSKIKAAAKLASECVQNIKTVQMLGLEKVLYNEYAHVMDSASRSSRKQSLMYALIYSISSTIIYLIYVVSSKYGAEMIVHKEITLVHVLRILFEVSFTAPIIGIACNYTQDFVKGKQAVSNLVKLKSTISTLDVFDNRGEKREVRGQVELREVEFAYPTRPGLKILRGLDLVIEPGQRVAIVGRSGCGKSTIISLLERFYNPDRGRILIDGIDIEKWDVSHLRRSIGLVTQEPVLFDGSIGDNIRYGCLDRNPQQQEVIQAARMANIHDFILTLPQGYDTSVGRGGTKLSGGQKQRIAIARALIRNPKILLLDEATSALDNHSEKLVQEALDKASQGRTTLVIAHRLSTVQSADIIVVIEDGLIIEKGTHSQLVALGGKYYTMTKAQQLDLT